MLLLNRRRYMHASNDVIMTAATNPEVLAICYAQGWCASADKMTKSEAEAVGSIGQVFRASGIVHFDEFKYFTNVTSIPQSAFQSCSSLTSIVLPSSVTALSGTHHFYQCTNLASITLPSGLTSIGNYSFYHCTNLALTALPSGIVSIGDNAFRDCTNLALTALPSGVTSIGAGAFISCTHLALTELPSGVTSIETNVFNGCSALALTALPSGVSEIKQAAFMNCANLAISEIPSGVTDIGNYSFYQCYALTDMTIPSGVTSIGQYAFNNDRNIATITCLATTAPSVSANTFTNTGSLASNKVLKVPSGASGYDAGYWQSVLQDTNGFTLQYI